jgi:CRP/FNR family transcriptional regulator, anaerobic regulatory protein
MMNKIDRETVLRRYPVLRELPPELLRKVEESSRPISAPAGTRLFEEGSACTQFPLLLQGVIRATKADPEGHEILLYRLNPGESCVITVVALLGESPYPAIGSAETDLTLYGVPRPVFLDLVLKSPAFRVFVFDFLSRRMAHLMTLIDDVAFRRVDQRLASRLLLHERSLSTTHQSLADELGTTREVVSRTLEAFKDSGMLRLGRKRIEILDRDALERVHRNEAR